MSMDYEQKKAKRGPTWREYSEMDRGRQEDIARDIRESSKKRYTNNKAIFDEGRIYFLQGYEFDEIEEKLRTNPNFKAGYDHEVNKEKIKDDLYQMGYEFAKSHDISEINPMYVNNVYYMEGFNRGKKKSR